MLAGNARVEETLHNGYDVFLLTALAPFGRPLYITQNALVPEAELKKGHDAKWMR